MRHCVFDCPHVEDLRQQHAELFQDSHDSVKFFRWHKDQHCVRALVFANVKQAQTS